jgi:hypothetical protein
VENSSCFCKLAFFLRADPLFSLDREKEFDLIGKMTIRELTPRPRRPWIINTPEKNGKHITSLNTFTSAITVLTGYKIATKESSLLAKFPRYCFCEETMNHKNLA